MQIDQLDFEINIFKYLWNKSIFYSPNFLNGKDAKPDTDGDLKSY